VPGAADALEERRDAVRRPDLADQIDVADVDAELERRGRDERLQLAALQRSSASRRVLRQAAVVRADGLLAEPVARCRATRSTIFRVLTKTSVVRWPPISAARRS
jgi:hypothetical protein